LIELVVAAQELQSCLESRGWKFCFIGGLALQHWGEQRVTRDVDATLVTGFGAEEPFIDALLSRFRGRLPDTRLFALRNRVLLLESSAGIPLDIALGGLPFESEVASRATRVEFAPGCPLLICSAEDLVVMKAFADRPRDWVDIEGILIRQEGRLDWGYITTQLTPLAKAKEAPGIVARLEAMRR
jgi:hypothetical protein